MKQLLLTFTYGTESRAGLQEKREQESLRVMAQLFEKSSPIDIKIVPFSSSHRTILLVVTFFLYKNRRKILSPYLKGHKSCALQAEAMKGRSFISASKMLQWLFLVIFPQKGLCRQRLVEMAAWMSYSFLEGYLFIHCGWMGSDGRRKRGERPNSC